MPKPADRKLSLEYEKERNREKKKDGCKENECQKKRNVAACRIVDHEPYLFWKLIAPYRADNEMAPPSIYNWTYCISG